MNKLFFVGLIFVAIIGMSFAGLIIEGGVISFEPVVSDKVISDVEFAELKSIFEKEGVIIDDAVGLDVNWVELSCVNNVCEYALYKEGLYNGVEISVDYRGVDSNVLRLAKLNDAIEKRINSTLNIWEKRQTNNTTIVPIVEGKLNILPTTKIKEPIK